MKFTYTVNIGNKRFRIEDEAATQQEFFEKVAPMQALEIAAFGRENVYLSFRTTRDGHKYYALVSPTDNHEFALGMSQRRPGELFPGKVVKVDGQKRTVRGWMRIQYNDGPGDEPEHDEEPQGAPEPETQERRALNTATTAMSAQRPLIQTGKTPPRNTTPPGNGVSRLAGKSASPSAFWAFQRANKLDESRAHAMVMAHTDPVSNTTDWAAALADLEALAHAPERNPAHEKINAAMDKLAVLGVRAEDIVARMSRVADGVCDVECLDAEQTAKVQAAFARWISELESGVQFTDAKRGRAA